MPSTRRPRTPLVWSSSSCLKKLGLNVELATSDWGSLVIRRASKKPVEEGGWSIFGTGWTGVETLDPSADLPLAANGGAAWFGWPERREARGVAGGMAEDDRQRSPAGDRRQDPARAFETLPYIPTGQWSPVTAYRKNLKGVIIAPALFMWNVEKT